MLREAVREGTPVGRVAQEQMESGGLVDDQVVIDIIRDRIDFRDCRNGFILDGFPRTLQQAIALDRMLKEKKLDLHAVVEIAVDDDLLVDRICGRLVHPPSGRSYHKVFNPPEHEGLDNVTGEPLVSRADDTEETVRSRLDNYHGITSQLIPYYRSKGIFKSVDGMQDIDQVTADLVKATYGLSGTGTLKGVAMIDPRTVKSGVRIGGTLSSLHLGTHAISYRSNSQFRDDLRKHDRVKYGPKDKYEIQPTNNMDYGWTVDLQSGIERNPALFHPRVSSKETTYANNLILGPRRV
jgi:adenylate kinase